MDVQDPDNPRKRIYKVFDKIEDVRQEEEIHGHEIKGTARIPKNKAVRKEFALHPGFCWYLGFQDASDINSGVISLLIIIIAYCPPTHRLRCWAPCKGKSEFRIRSSAGNKVREYSFTM